MLMVITFESEAGSTQAINTERASGLTFLKQSFNDKLCRIEFCHPARLFL